MNDDTILEVDERSYTNPQTGLAEQTEFIDTLRGLQAEKTAEINQNTYNLGSQVPSNIGGLTGSEGLWQAQYQTPQTDAQIANLRATAQQQALNQALQNESDIMQNRYKQALRGYYKRQRDKNNTPDTNTTPKGDVEVKTSDTILAELQDVPTNSQFYKIATNDDYIPGYAPGVSAITGATEQERRLKAIAQIIAQQQAEKDKK